jgi:hypothetical protein
MDAREAAREKKRKKNNPVTKDKVDYDKKAKELAKKLGLKRSQVGRGR